MTVKELKQAIKAYKDSDCVYLVKDWEAVDDNGALTELSSLESVTDQLVVYDCGLDFEEERQVLLCFEND